MRADRRLYARVRTGVRLRGWGRLRGRKIHRRRDIHGVEASNLQGFASSPVEADGYRCRVTRHRGSRASLARTQRARPGPRMGSVRGGEGGYGADVVEVVVGPDHGGDDLASDVESACCRSLALWLRRCPGVTTVAVLMIDTVFGGVVLPDRAHVEVEGDVVGVVGD